MTRFQLREPALYPVLHRAFSICTDIHIKFSPKDGLEIWGRDENSVLIAQAKIEPKALDVTRSAESSITVSQKRFAEAMATGDREDAEAAQFNFFKNRLEITMTTKLARVRTRLTDIPSSLRRLPRIQEFRPDATYRTSEPAKFHSALLFLKSSTRWEEVEEYHLSEDDGNLALEDPNKDLIYTFRDSPIEGSPDSWITKGYLEAATRIAELAAVANLALAVKNGQVFKFDYEVLSARVTYHVGARLRGD